MWRIVDISESNRRLSISRKSLVVTTGDEDVGSVPISDIHAVIVHGHGATVSLSLVSELSENGIPLVLADRNHQPTTLCMPVNGHFEIAGRLSFQASYSKARQARIWRDIVKQKISGQAQTLLQSGNRDATAMKKFINTVRPGDPNNVEARAARFYWKRLFGADFKREKEGKGLNASLNYGYTVLRATVARAVVAVGLSPGLGVHHRSRLNAFQLVDDLMEPLRPVVDLCVWKGKESFSNGLTSSGKAELAKLVNQPMHGMDGTTPLSNIAVQIAYSLVEVFLGERKVIWLPSTLNLVEQNVLDWHE